MCDVSDDPSLRRARAAPANRLETRVHHLSPHSFRVTTITDVLEQGVPLEDVQRLAGPADPRTTRLGTEVTIIDMVQSISQSVCCFSYTFMPSVALLVVEFTFSCGFVGYGDADPSNVSTLVRGAEMRVAETRDVNRALRKAYGIGICSVEEIGRGKARQSRRTI